jgi:hypothetical protein
MYVNVCIYIYRYINIHIHIHQQWHGWEDSIKVDLQEVGCGGIDWIKLAKDRER